MIFKSNKKSEIIKKKIEEYSTFINVKKKLYTRILLIVRDLPVKFTRENLRLKFDLEYKNSTW